MVHRLLEDAAALSPGAVALIEPRRTITYAELNRLANRYAHLLIATGVRRGDRVVMALENSTDLVALYFGTLKAGAIAVPLPAGPRSDRLVRAVVDSSPAVAVVDPATAHEISSTHPLASVPSLFVSSNVVLTPGRGVAYARLQDAVQSVSDGPVDVRSIDVDLAAIIYTSGSTGEPRGVMLSHRNFVANTQSIVQYLRLTSHDRVMCVLPFYYVYGLSLLHTHIAVGGSIVIDNRFAFPNVVLNAMQQHRVTGFAGVPSTFALLLHRSGLQDVTLPHLRYVTQAGGGMAPARVLEWLERGPRVPFYVMYGATEASARLTYLDPARLRDKLGSIGRPIPNVDIVVVTEQDTIADTGEIGELVARGTNISRGYWNDEEETRQKFGPRGYYTGDLGYADEEGFLFLVGRKHDMLKVGAHRVGAKEIEDVLQGFPGLHEVAVVPAPHAILGEVPVAFVSMRDGEAADAEGLGAFCRARLPPHKVPTGFFLRTELPKLGTVGKIDKVRLREEARASVADATA
jgi:acyl-CoA synthetase (AMP-forming)/AMP-acid ligase II